MLAEPERRLQPGAVAEVEHRAQLPLHGAAVQLRARAQAGRVFQVADDHHGADPAGAEGPRHQERG